MSKLPLGFQKTPYPNQPVPRVLHWLLRRPPREQSRESGMRSNRGERCIVLYPLPVAEAVVEGFAQRRDRFIGLPFHRKVAGDVVQNRRVARLHCERAPVPVTGFLRLSEERQVCGTHVEGARIVGIQLEMFARRIVAASRSTDCFFSFSEAFVSVREQSERSEVVRSHCHRTLVPLC